MRAASLVVLVSALTASTAAAQEIVGRRLFSDTLVIVEPFVEDELSPSFLRILRPRTGEATRAWATEFDGEVKKRLTQDLEQRNAFLARELEETRKKIPKGTSTRSRASA